jgi:hypothetical protein
MLDESSIANDRIMLVCRESCRWLNITVGSARALPDRTDLRKLMSGRPVLCSDLP